MSSCLSGFYMFSEETEEATSGGGGMEHHQHAASSKLGDVDMDKSNPWFNNGSYEFFSINRPVPKRKESYLQEVFPTVKSALEEYDMKCNLYLDKRQVSFATYKIPDLENLLKGRELFQLLELDVPACQVIAVLKKGRMCSESGINMDQFVGQDKICKPSQVDHMEIENEVVLDAKVNELISVYRRIPKSMESIIKKVLPMVKSAIEEYCVPCKLTLWGDFIRFLATTKSVDLDSFVMVRELLLLLSINVPADKAITVLTGRQWLIVLTGSDVKEGLCKKFGIKRGQFLERNKLLLASNKELEQITGCDIFITEGYVLGIGPLKGLKLVQRIVKDCILHNVPPASRIRTVKKTLKTMKKFEGLRLCD